MEEVFMIGLVVTLKVKDGTQAAFEAAMEELIPQVRANEPGCLLYSMTRKKGSATEYVMMEQYRSQADIDHHNGTAYFQAALPKLMPCLDGAPQTLMLDILK
jgi:quinol monooxygenase YgiN